MDLDFKSRGQPLRASLDVATRMVTFSNRDTGERVAIPWTVEILMSHGWGLPLRLDDRVILSGLAVNYLLGWLVGLTAAGTI